LLGGHAYFLHWGVVQISLANLIVIVLMVLIFVLAVVLQFPHAHRRDDTREDTDVRG
jgi:uncharacterized membrane protein